MDAVKRWLAPVAGVVLVAPVLAAQTAGRIPPDQDPSVWGRANQPYIANVQVTTRPAEGDPGSQLSVSRLQQIYRDSAGRVRTEGFYDNGQLMTVLVRDPTSNTATSSHVVSKTATVLRTPRPMLPPPGKGWVIEPLAPRRIAGIEAEGQRFTRTIPVGAGGGGTVTVVEEVWTSYKLGLVLERHIRNPLRGSTDEFVVSVAWTEPSSELFTVPDGYTIARP